MVVNPLKTCYLILTSPGLGLAFYHYSPLSWPIISIFESIKATTRDIAPNILITMSESESRKTHKSSCLKAYYLNKNVCLKAANDSAIHKVSRNS